MAVPTLEPTPPPATAGIHRARRPRARRYLMCRPESFAVTYSINPWMRPAVPVDRARALRQWEALADCYRALGHTVELVEPEPGLPDMVFAANSGFVLDGRVLAARFRYPERRREEAPYRDWFAGHGFTDLVVGREPNEGEGDFAVAGDLILAASGYRSAPGAHDEAREVFGRPVVSLRLVDPRFYHLDTALTVLDDGEIMWFPPAFSPGSRCALARLFPDAVEADEADALVFGVNAVSDGYHVVLPAQATGLVARLRERGFEPVPVDVSELRKAGGGVKCCTLELRGRGGGTA